MKKQIRLIASMMAMLGTSYVDEPEVATVRNYEPTEKKYSRNRDAPHAASTQRKRRKYARQNQHCKYAKYKRA